MKLLKKLLGGLLFVLGILATVFMLRRKDSAAHEEREAELIDEVEKGTDEARERAESALGHLEVAKQHEAAATDIANKGAPTDEEVDNAFGNFQSRARRGVRDDKP